MSGKPRPSSPIEVKTLKVDDEVEIHSSTMEFCDATDLFNDIMAAVGGGGGGFMAGYGNRGESLAAIAKELAGGRLTAYLARILSCTTVIVRGEHKCKVELINSREKLNAAFTGRSKYVFPAVKLAVEVNYSGFLDGLKSIGIDPLKGIAGTTESPSDDSNPSTESTG